MRYSWRMALAAVAGMTFGAEAAMAAPLARPASFAMCAVCHTTGAGEKARLGPNLWAVGGRKAGSAPGFAYSPAMKASGVVWNRASLLKFIADPRKAVPGNKMAFAGQKNPQQAAQIVDYLLSLK